MTMTSKRRKPFLFTVVRDPNVEGYQAPQIQTIWAYDINDANVQINAMYEGQNATFTAHGEDPVYNYVNNANQAGGTPSTNFYNRDRQSFYDEERPTIEPQTQIPSEVVGEGAEGAVSREFDIQPEYYGTDGAGETPDTFTKQFEAMKAPSITRPGEMDFSMDERGEILRDDAPKYFTDKLEERPQTAQDILKSMTGGIQAPKYDDTRNQRNIEIPSVIQRPPEPMPTPTAQERYLSGQNLARERGPFGLEQMAGGDMFGQGQQQYEYTPRSAMESDDRMYQDIMRQEEERYGGDPNMISARGPVDGQGRQMEDRGLVETEQERRMREQEIIRERMRKDKEERVYPEGRILPYDFLGNKPLGTPEEEAIKGEQELERLRNLVLEGKMGREKAMDLYADVIPSIWRAALIPYQDNLLDAGYDPNVIGSRNPGELQSVLRDLERQGFAEKGEIGRILALIPDFNVLEEVGVVGEEEGAVQATPSQTYAGLYGGRMDSADLQGAMEAIAARRAGDTSATLPENILNSNLPQAQRMVDEFLMADTTARGEAIQEAEMITIPREQIEAQLDIAGMEQESSTYRDQVGFASDVMKVQSEERMQNAGLRSNEAIASASNQSQEYIAELTTQTNFGIAKMNNMTEREVALIGSRTTLEAAEITGMTARDVERIKGQIAQSIADATNLSKETVTRLQAESNEYIALTQAESGENIARLNSLTSVAIADATNQSQYDIQKYQQDAMTNVAKANNTNEMTIAKIQYGESFTARTESEFANLKSLEEIRKEYQTELAKLSGTTEEQIANINNTATGNLQTAQIEFEKLKYEEEIKSQERIAGLATYMDELSMTEYVKIQNDIARGGMTYAESESLAALVARGGLTPEQRMEELDAATRSDQMNALVALLSNPSALGAFVTAISGELPFETVPTMAQLVEMAPDRISYLEGAMSAIGIDPQTFIKMAQEVTPQAFQESGPFSNISAMVA